MGQCTSKSGHENKSSSSGSSSGSSSNISQTSIEEKDMSVGGGLEPGIKPEEVKCGGQVRKSSAEKEKVGVVARPKVVSEKFQHLKGCRGVDKTSRVYVDNNTSEDISQLSDLSSTDSRGARINGRLGRLQARKAMGQVGRKVSDSSADVNGNGNAKPVVDYANVNPVFTVHDVVKKSGCETFVIDFDSKEAKKRPPSLAPKKPPVSQLSKTSGYSSSSQSSPSRNLKSRAHSSPPKNKNVRLKKATTKKVISLKQFNAATPLATKTSRMQQIRSNKENEGRIHSAVVSGIKYDSRNVTEEWLERRETKSKEIQLDAILSRKQDLPPQTQIILQNKLSKYVPRPTAGAPLQSSRSAAISSAPVVQTNQPNYVSGSQGSVTRTRNKGRPTMNGVDIVQHNQQGIQHHQQQQVHIQQQIHQQQVLTQNMDETTQNGTDNGGGKPTGWGRRSNVVKQVEKLKKNREERRAKQQEIMEEKVALKNNDPGNPNWEFLSMIREYQEQLEYNPLQDGDAHCDHQITVCVRKRPLNKKEKQRKEVDVITVPNKNQTIIHEPKTKVDLTKYLDNQHFRFDYAFDDTCSNELVYKYSARPLVQNIFEGGMATCFAYGQTGSGKTHTMGGEFHGKTQDSKNGIYALAAKDVFKFLNSPKYKSNKLQVSCSYFEIYSGKVFDLLSGKSKLRVLEDGKQQVVIVGLMEKTVDSVEDVLKLINLGNNVRTSGQTSANAHSSRSHAVFQIILRNEVKKSLYGKFSLIDLAGNERGADTSSANRQTRMEGAEINKSLLALKECIRALGRKGAHLPFRASKLTQVLRDSFIGEKSKTCMIAMVSPSLSSCEHTLNTLRYADRVKELGAEDPILLKVSPDNGHDDSMRLDDGVLSPEDSDLAQLRSLNEGELSADWYNFQEAVSHLQSLEEDLVDGHRSVILNLQRWAVNDASLLALTNEVDYDQDAYCLQLEEMISEKIEAFVNLRNKARYFRECLNDEESKSRLLVRRN